MKGLSPRAQRLIVALAQDEGRKSGSAYILPEHVILAMLKKADSVGYSLLLACTGTKYSAGKRHN